MDWASKLGGAKRRRRTAALRLILLALVIWFCYDTAVHRSQAGDQANATRVERLEKPVAESIGSYNGIVSTKSLRRSGSQRNTQLGLESSPQAINAAYANDNTGDPVRQVDVRDALHRILTVLPDELHIRDLLRPIAGTGEERLREMGLRTRSFKVLFEAWEDLHCVRGPESMYVRDDMISYIKRHSELSSSLQVDLAQMIRSYEAYRSVITRLSMLLFPWTAPYFSDHTILHSQLYSGGRGLVFSAGDAQAPFLLTSIPSIRRLGCDLPIEVLYLGDGDLSEDFRSDLESLPGVITRDLSQMVNDSGWTLAGWAGKPFAILLSSFREVIYIDADSLFFQNPELLFEDPLYLETGALFFKDRLMMPEVKKRWLQRIIPKPISKNVVRSRLWTGESGHMQESGVVVVDTWKHFVALLLVTRMNGPDRDGNAAEGKIGVYDMVYGDKETFWLGWELAGDPGYAFHEGDAGIMGMLEPRFPPSGAVNESIINKLDQTSTSPPDVLTNYTICAPQLLHLDRHGRPLWFNGWLLPNKFADHKQQEPAKFEAYLREPREVGDPGAWQLHENNICCLTSTSMAKFSDIEQDTLQMIIESGRRSGALAPRIADRAYSF